MQIKSQRKSGMTYVNMNEMRSDGGGGVECGTWLSGRMCLSEGLELKKEDSGEGRTMGSGLTKPLRSHLAVVFSSVCSTTVSMA